ncbi:hypothetical protein JFL43_03295 [Viridibacillus sp. YIM B01967]|uniref:Integral membrane protein n=1 Tax=Viridibacillus soli TaxID=2798301 RepID=A0ABS1H3C8_9BACL|nr:hypothetical protein [Viridibacillus soli]MBK3493897.1 hypothetical protein [Viridibacillus soli]
MIVWIITAEIAFWIAIMAALFSRYILKKLKLSTFLFILVPLIDLALIVFTIMDLRNGAIASSAHGISAIYIGVSIAYGKTMITWADEKFQVWFLKINLNKKPLTGVAKGMKELKLFGQHIIAYLLGSSMLWLMITIVGHQEDTTALEQVWKIWSLVLLIDGVISLSYILFPTKKKTFLANIGL